MMEMNDTTMQDATLENVDALDLHLNDEKNGDVTNGLSGTKRPISKDSEHEFVQDDYYFFTSMQMMIHTLRPGSSS